VPECKHLALWHEITQRRWRVVQLGLLEQGRNSVIMHPSERPLMEALAGSSNLGWLISTGFW